MTHYRHAFAVAMSERTHDAQHTLCRRGKRFATRRRVATRVGKPCLCGWIRGDHIRIRPPGPSPKIDLAQSSVHLQRDLARGGDDLPGFPGSLRITAVDNRWREVTHPVRYQPGLCPTFWEKCT